MTKEYLTVKELSKQYKVSLRNIRKIITKLSSTTSKDLLYKDANHIWQIHHILSSNFKPQRAVKNRYYALSVDLCRNIPKKEIEAIIRFVCSNMHNERIEINYVIENKITNNSSHLHCYINCQQKNMLIKNLRLGFSNISFQQNKIFDLTGWKNYMTKNGEIITTIKN